MREDIIKRVKEILSEILENDKLVEQLKMEDSLLELGISSMNYIKSIVAIEQEYDIEFDDEELSYEKFGTLSALVTNVERLIEAQK